MTSSRAPARLVLALVVLAGTFVLFGNSAGAAFHLIKVTEIFGGTAAQPNAQFVELQMYASGQQFVSGHAVTVFDAGGTEVGRFTFVAAVSNGADQASILIATPEAEALFETTADLEMTPVIQSTGGKVCWGEDIDCASWGGYSGDPAGSGTPFNQQVGLVAGQAMERDVSGGENPDGLDADDDTDDSAADFQLASPSPTNNAGAAPPSESPGPEPDPGDQAHPRSVTLSLRGSLRARGRVDTEHGIPPCERRVPVRVERKRSSGWKTVKKGSTNARARYSFGLRDRRGRYRTLAPATTKSGERCARAVSPVRRRR